MDVAKSIPGVSVISMSWGGAEFQGETALDSHFLTPAGHTPITFLAATGDTGAGTGAEWPASSPNVIAVGGTALYVDTSGNYQGEQGWSGSGGGYSSYESEPAYQLGAQSTGTRATPDVAIDASPNTGLLAYSTAPSNGVGSWDATGGTSLSTQLWAGLIADADQAQCPFGAIDAGHEHGLVPALQQPGAFHDVAWGLNGYWSTPGYDLVTGLGTPKANSVVSALSPLPSTVTVAGATPVVPAIAPVVPKATHTKPPRHRTRSRHDLAATTATDTAATTEVATAVDATPIIAAPATGLVPSGVSAAATATATAATLPSIPSTSVLQSTGTANAPARTTATNKAPTAPATKAKPAASLPDGAPSRKSEKREGTTRPPTPEAEPRTPAPKANPEDPKAPNGLVPDVERTDDSGASDRDRLVPEGVDPERVSTAAAPPMAPPTASSEEVDPASAEESPAIARTPALGLAAFTLIALWRSPAGPGESRRRSSSPYRQAPAGPLGLGARQRD